MDLVLASLAVFVLFMIAFVTPQYRACGLAVAVALGLGAWLLRRCEYGDKSSSRKSSAPSSVPPPPPPPPSQEVF